jgi:preprotein translocase subunit SecA
VKYDDISTEELIHKLGAEGRNQQALREEEKERQRQRDSRVQQATSRSGPKIGRNEPFPCGSGKKYKKCHGRPGA